MLGSYSSFTAWCVMDLHCGLVLKKPRITLELYLSLTIVSSPLLTHEFFLTERRRYTTFASHVCLFDRGD